MFTNHEQPRLRELRIRRNDCGRVAAIRYRSYVYARTLCCMYRVFQSRPIAIGGYSAAQSGVRFGIEDRTPTRRDDLEQMNASSALFRKCEGR
jgi:hypothetical protein